MDILSPRARSQRMRAIQSCNTRPEVVLRRALFKLGLRYRLHRKDLPGTPDIVLPRYWVAIQVRGCFWHHHSCARGKWPSSREDYWRAKLLGNVRRDRRTDRALRELGWSVVVVWECALTTPQAVNRKARYVYEMVNSGSESGGKGRIRGKTNIFLP